MSLIDKLDFSAPEKCLLAQAVLWLGRGLTPLPPDAFLALPEDDEIQQSLKECQDAKKALFLALRSARLTSEGIFYGQVSPVDFAFARRLPRPLSECLNNEQVSEIKKDAWEWDRVDWARSLLATPPVKETMLESMLAAFQERPLDPWTFEIVLVPTGELFDLFSYRRPIPTIKARTECESWIRELASDGKIRRKFDVWEDAQSKFGNQLSKRGFNSAWTNATTSAQTTIFPPRIWVPMPRSWPGFQILISI